MTPGPKEPEEGKEEEEEEEQEHGERWAERSGKESVLVTEERKGNRS